MHLRAGRGHLELPVAAQRVKGQHIVEVVRGEAPSIVSTAPPARAGQADAGHQGDVRRPARSASLLPHTVDARLTISSCSVDGTGSRF